MTDILKKYGLDKKPGLDKSTSSFGDNKIPEKNRNENTDYWPLPHWSKNCKTCFGRGHVGFNETIKEYQICPRCGPIPKVFINSYNGLLKFGSIT